ncbi:MAG: dihydrofolate reductase [Mycoplasmataceae bacterium]|nr:dihydrofolate reductase [Mycoplasmataceae bacterium]
MISLIWAQDIHKGIGIDNLLPWNIKEEMDHFRSVTRGQTVVMGQKTFESIGKPLVNRTNVVLSDDLNWKHEGVVVYNDMKKLIDDFKVQHIYIIGGKTIYQLFAPIADELVVTKLKESYNCNRFLDIDFSNFELVKSESHEEFTAEWWQLKK